MSISVVCEVRDYPFDKNVLGKLYDNHYAAALWPVVYLLVNNTTKEIYIGETTNIYKRIKKHLKDEKKSGLKTLFIISSNKFTASITREIESNLLKYIPCDGKYRSINGNKGILTHNYFQKRELYWNVFEDVWAKLNQEKIVSKSLKFISNSNLFKYSPYKSLSPDQCKALISILENLLNDKTKTTIVEGGAGTGKSVLAVFLFALLKANWSDINFKEFGENEKQIIRILLKLKARYKNPKMALVVPMYSFRVTLKKVFKKIDGLSEDMVIGPAQMANQKFDFIIVEESHRLHRRKNLGRYFGKFDEISNKLKLDKLKNTELNWVQNQGRKNVLFYDEYQTIKPSDIEVDDFNYLKSQKSTFILELKSQLRCKGGDNYIKFIQKLMNCSFTPNVKKYNAERYSFLMYESLSDLIEAIKLREQENELSRLVAGFAWPWDSKKDKDTFDIKIAQNLLRWNTVTSDWIHSPKAVSEVGCIHTSQGYDLNYAAVILGNDISFDEKKKEIIILVKNYFDKNGKSGVKDPIKLKKYIINIYSTLLKRGIHGTYIYVCDPALRKYMSQYIHVVKDKRVSKPVLKLVVRKQKNTSGNMIPLLDVKAAAGGFSPDQLAYEKKIKLPAGIKPTSDMFACQVVGESMNEKIPNGAICLFKLDQGGSRDGKIVLVQHAKIQDRDFGDGFTVKLYRSEKVYKKDQWRHKSITLLPESNNSAYEPIVLSLNKDTELTVIGIFIKVLYPNGLEDKIVY